MGRYDLPGPATGAQFWLGVAVAFLGPVGGVSLYWNVLWRRHPTLEGAITWISIIAGFYAVFMISYRTWHFYDEDNNFAYVNIAPVEATLLPANTAYIKNNGNHAIQNASHRQPSLPSNLILRLCIWTVGYNGRRSVKTSHCSYRQDCI
jgi:hypothetical protein